MKHTILLILLLLAAPPLWAQRETEVSIKYSDRQGRPITLAGTFTTPEGKAPRGGWPAMVLITGSGSQNRDSELFGLKPFKVIADYMATHGIATLRCDDRGVGGTGGVFDDITPFDLVDDIQAQWQWLSHAKKVNPRQVGLLGHSEGGQLAPMAAAQNAEIGFVVMLAGPALSMGVVLLDQNEKIFLQKGNADTLVACRIAFMRRAYAICDSLCQGDTVQLVKRLNKALREAKDQVATGLTKDQKQAVGLTNADCFGWAKLMAQPYVRVMLSLDPKAYLSQLRCPLLALNGTLDCQVDAATNLAAIRQAVQPSGIPFDAREMAGMNHLFQRCQTGAITEYETAGQSPDNEALSAITAWLEATLGHGK